MMWVKTIIMCCFLALAGSLLEAQQTASSQTAVETSPSLFDLMSYDEVVKLKLTTDLSLLEENRNQNEYQPAVLEFKDSLGQKEEWDLRVRVRGRFRRRVCNFPPIKLEFSKGDLRKRRMLTFDDLKLVTHCIDDPVGNEYLLREYLAYQLYRELSPYHFRTQLVRIKYVDTNSSHKFTRYGIIIEDEDDMASRYQSDLCEEDCYALPADSLQASNCQTLCLFQYMIGNTDYSLQLIRNLKVLKPRNGDRFLMVPYDFDFSALVGASYATPDPVLELESIYERLYLGFESSPEELQSTIDYFRSKKAELYRIVEDYRLLDSVSRKQITKLLDVFYEQIEEGELNFQKEEENND